MIAPLRTLVSAGLKGNSFRRSAPIRQSAEVVLPYDIPTVEILYKAGIDITGPIHFKYDFGWHKQSPPFQHQKITADFITKLRRGFVFNDIGTGKTLSVLWAIDYLKSLGYINKILIITTLSTVRLVWADTLFKSFPHLSFEVLTGTREQRLKKLQKDVDVYIVNHDGLKVLCDWRKVDKKSYFEHSVLNDRDDIDMFVVDECAIYRNAQTQTFVAVKNTAIAKRRLWLLSGDPMPNRPTDIWAQAQLVKPGLLDKYFVRFRNRTMTKVTDYKWVPKQGWEHYIYSELKHYSVRFLRDECIDLPPTVSVSFECEMGAQQRKAYNDMLTRCKAEIGGQQISAVNEGVKINKLLQIACGGVYDCEGNSYQFDIEAKFKVLLEVVEQSHHKLIVYAPFIHIVKQLKEKLEKHFSVGVVYGAVAKRERDRIFHDFQHGDLQILLAQPQTMAHGLDLTRAHTVCWWSPIDNNEIFNQANGRVSRPGQAHKQTIAKLICSSIEKKIYQRLEQKEKMQGLLMELLTTKV